MSSLLAEPADQVLVAPADLVGELPDPEAGRRRPPTGSPEAGHAVAIRMTLREPEAHLGSVARAPTTIPVPSGCRSRRGSGDTAAELARHQQCTPLGDAQRGGERIGCRRGGRVWCLPPQ